MKPLANKRLAKLKGYFEDRDDVAMAFLFGSWSKGRACEESDVDIAVYFRSEANGMWSEDEREFPAEALVWADVENILEREVDLLVLNRASPTVGDSAIRGTPIIIKDRRAYMNFLIRVVSEAIDMREWVESYWEHKKRRGHAIAA